MKRIIVWLFFAPLFVAAQEQYQANVTNVIDGNTLEVLAMDGQVYQLMFAGIDAPELTQAFGHDAKALLEKLVLGRDVQVQVAGKDRWGNRLAIIQLTKNGVDPRVEMLESGYAWTAERNPIPELEQIRLVAKEKGKGLWKDPAAVAPWIFRRQQTMMQAKSSMP